MLNSSQNGGLNRHESAEVTLAPNGKATEKLKYNKQINIIG